MGPLDSSQLDIDKHLSASLQKILLETITFHEAKMIDEGDHLSRKYKPINPGYKPPSKMAEKRNESNEIAVGVPKPPIVIFDEGKVNLQWKDIRRIGPGLANLGNTCFLNSVLQVLTYTAPFTNLILSGVHKNNCQAVGFCMLCELVNHIGRVFNHSPQNGAVRPMSIIQKIKCIGKHFRFGRQEDAHEFLRYVVEGIQKSDYAGKPKYFVLLKVTSVTKRLDKLSKETTLANAVFGGFYRSQVKCLHCHYESNTYDPMMDMNLDIKECSSIMQALQRSVKPDRLDGDNKYHCERCRMKTVAQKRGNIHKEPNVLTFQLKRFDFTQMFGGKISNSISFPEELNIRSFMSAQQGHPVWYKLYAVLVHSGYSCNSGHYYCYVKAPNGTWYEMNDARVSQVGLQTVLSAQAYLLFYVKKEKTKPQNMGIPPSTKAATATKAKPISLNTYLSSSSNLQTPKKYDTNNTSFGTPVQRKLETKINWYSTPSKPESQNRPTLIDTTNKNHEKMNVKKSDSIKLKLKTAPSNSLLKPKPEKIESSLNSLQKLSQSYEDSDSPVNSASVSPAATPTPTDVKPLGTIERNKAKPEKIRKETKFSDKSKTGQENNLPSPKKSNEKISLTLPLFNNKNREKQSPLRKLPNPTFGLQSKFNTWSPVTKAPLHPRVIIHKCHATDSENHKKVKEKKGDESSEKTPIKKDQQEEFKLNGHTSTEESSTATQEQDFVPRVPQLSVAKRQRDDPLNSEITEANGENISLKTPKNEETPLTMKTEGNQVNDVPSRKRKHDRDDHMQKDASEANILLRETIVNGLSDDEYTTPKKKKKKHKKKHKKHKYKELENELSEDSGYEEKKSKKKKKKHKHKRHNFEIKCRKIESFFHPTDDKRDSMEDTLITGRNHPHVEEHTILNSTYREESPLPEKPLRKSAGRDNTFSPNKTHRDEPRIHTSSRRDRNVSPHRNTSERKSYNHIEKSSNHSQSIYNGKDRPRQIDSHYRMEREDSRHSSRSSSRYSPSRNERDDSRHSSRNLSRHHSPERDEEFGHEQFSKTKCSRSSHTDSPYSKEYKRKKDAPSFMWDEKKKPLHTWDGSMKNSKTLDYLLQDTGRVKSWKGEESTHVYNMKNRDENKKEKYQDEWDEEYDAGKMKKNKNKRPYEGDEDRYKKKNNEFQKLQDFRNQTKDSKASHRSPTKESKYHRKKHSKDSSFHQRASKFF